jgi:hypothetical protein
MIDENYKPKTSGQKCWVFSKYFFPFFFLIIGLALVIGGMADVGYVPPTLTCNDWREANYEYNKIRDASGGDLNIVYPDLSLSRFSEACALWKAWFSFAIISVFLYAAVLAWPLAYTIGKRYMYISLETVVIATVISSLLTFIFVIVFFGVAGAWKYKWKCGAPVGNSTVPQCAWFTGGTAYPNPPPPNTLPWNNASDPFRNIMTDPKFWARYGLQLYGTADTTITCIGAFFGALGAVLVLVLENSNYKKWEKLTSANTSEGQQSPGNYSVPLNQQAPAVVAATAVPATSSSAAGPVQVMPQSSIVRPTVA